MKKVLSVIIPVYNMEKYIRQCLESLMIKEVLDKIEILVVLDGSTDRSEEIAMEYAKAHPYSVRVISKPNGGHGSAINTGMDNAVGEYVKVLDSDDWVNIGDFIEFVKRLKEETADAVICDYRKEHVYNGKSEYFEYKDLEDGKKYKLNSDIKTVLFMGVDKEEKADLGNNPGENGQSDSLNLLVLNKEEKKAQIVQISRDSMVGIDIYDVTGNKLMTEEGQIALQYAYGDGAEESCRLTSEKVSDLMYGVNVDSYFSLTLEGLVAATDAVGGITLTVPEDYTEVDPAFEKDAVVTLNGELAEKYVRKRDIEVLDSNNQRMERQSQFIGALIEKMQSIDGKSEYLSLYQQLTPYMTTNMTADELEELSNYKIEAETIKVPGEIIEKDGHAQYIVDNKELKKIVLKLFYKMV